MKGAPAWPRVDAGRLPRFLTIGTPTRADILTPLREQVRETSLASSAAAWKSEPIAD